MKGDEGKLDALWRMQQIRDKNDDYKAISRDEAAELAETIVDYDNDVRAHALITLLNGIMCVVFSGEGGRSLAEDLVWCATRRAYTLSLHCNYSLSEFASLDPKNARDKRVLEHEYDEDEKKEQQ
jgi:hypothetical protein